MQLVLAPSSVLLARVRPLLPYAIVAAFAALVFAALCDAVGDHDGVTAVDRPVSLWFAAHRTGLEGHLGLLLAKATSPAVLVVAVGVAAVLLRRAGRRLESTLLAGAVVLAYGVGAIAKLGEHRARPLAPVNLAPESEASFPSGHVLVVGTVAFVVLALAWPHLGRAGRAWGVAAAAGVTVVIAVDRLVVGAHWLTDVAGSLALVVVITALVAGVRRFLAPAQGRVA